MHEWIKDAWMNKGCKDEKRMHEWIKDARMNIGCMNE